MTPGTQNNPIERPTEGVVQRVVFIDGESAEHLRVVEHGEVRTLAWTGPRCRSMRTLRVRRGLILALCSDGGLLRIDPFGASSERLVRPQRGGYVALEVDDQRVWLADADAKIWERRFRPDDTLGLPRLVFANRAMVRTPEGVPVAETLLPQHEAVEVHV